ncbi:MAG: ORF6N domain-containing protein [Patescibacteria group bacterium]
MESVLVPFERIEQRIYLIRGKKVMLDRDLAELYGVKTHVLNQAVKRNIKRFPEDFMFKLSLDEAQNLISQFVISSSGWGGRRHVPLAFTEQGIAMLSSVLKSERAILVNIQIIRTFTKLREMISENDYLRRKLEAMEMQYDEQFKIVFDALRRVLTVEDEPKSEIGFKG